MIPFWVLVMSPKDRRAEGGGVTLDGRCDDGPRHGGVEVASPLWLLAVFVIWYVPAAGVKRETLDALF